MVVRPCDNDCLVSEVGTCCDRTATPVENPNGFIPESDAVMQVVLVMFRAGGDRRSFSVTRDITVIGRREDCDLRIPVSEVSRKHCRIIREGATIRAEDLGSSNGTFHNGQRIAGSATIEPGDSIQVGPVVFVLQVDGSPPDDELAPFQERAAHHLDDSLAEHPPLLANEDSAVAAENIEILENTPAEDIDPLPVAQGAESVELDLSDDSGTAAGHQVLSESDLMMDLSAVEDTHNKH